MILEKQKKETTSNVLLSINITIKRFQNAYEKKAVFNWMKKKKPSTRVEKMTSIFKNKSKHKGKKITIKEMQMWNKNTIHIKDCHYYQGYRKKFQIYKI